MFGFFYGHCFFLKSVFFSQNSNASTEMHKANLEEWAWYILDVVVATWSDFFHKKRS